MSHRPGRGAARRVLGAALPAALVAAWLPTPAHAAVEITPATVVVSTDGARAVVSRKPFRVEFQDAQGHAVLGELPNEGAAPFPVPPTPHPEPFSAQLLARPTLYGPLTFMVGESRTVQPCPGNVCGGNQFTGLDSGVEYSARDVVEATPRGTGVKLDVSTSDPSGRKLEVTIEPGPGRSIRLRAEPNPSDGVVVVADAFGSPKAEAFRGFGGRHDALDHRGHEFYSWPEQENRGDTGGDPNQENYQFPNGPHAAYYPQALFYSSEPYGFLVNQTDLSWFNLASDRADAWRVAAVGDHVDYVVAPGDAKTAINTITGINGRHRMPPAWAVGPMSSHFRPTSNTEGDRQEQTIRRDIEMIKKHKIVLDAYDMFGWGNFDTAKVKDLIAEFHKLDVKVLSYFFGFVDTNEHGFGEDGMFEEALARGYYVKTAAGTPYFITSPLVVGTAVMIDFTNPEAVKWWQQRIKRNLDLGFDGFMEDFGEQISVDMHFHNGETGATMHNRYPNLYHAATRPALEEYEREHPGRKIYNYTRSGFSGIIGQPGSAWGEIANFPGDNTADWSQASGLRSASVDMLSRAVGGAWGYSTDIGGYLGDTPRELFVRWVEWAALSPYFRLHNSSSNGTRQPWFYDEGPTIEIWNKFARLHQEVRPLILDLAREAQDTGIPPTRPLWLEFPGDAEAAKQEQQWMLGPDVLVAPVVTEGATSRDVYFPAGCWQHGETGERFDGRRTAKVEAKIDSLPYFFRCGTDPPAEAAGDDCRDRIAPRSTVAGRSFRASRRGLAVSGNSSDKGCRARGASRPGKVERVYVSLAKVDRRGCRFVNASGRVERRVRPCRRPVLLPANGTRRWTFRKPMRLSPGRYRLQVRAVDAVRNKERPSTRARVLFRLR